MAGSDRDVPERHNQRCSSRPNNINAVNSSCAKGISPSPLSQWMMRTLVVALLMVVAVVGPAQASTTVAPNTTAAPQPTTTNNATQQNTSDSAITVNTTVTTPNTTSSTAAADAGNTTTIATTTPSANINQTTSPTVAQSAGVGTNGTSESNATTAITASNITAITTTAAPNITSGASGVNNSTAVVPTTSMAATTLTPTLQDNSTVSETMPATSLPANSTVNETTPILTLDNSTMNATTTASSLPDNSTVSATTPILTLPANSTSTLVTTTVANVTTTVANVTTTTANMTANATSTNASGDNSTTTAAVTTTTLTDSNTTTSTTANDTSPSVTVTTPSFNGTTSALAGVTTPSGLCANVNCSNHGNCSINNGSAVCNCYDGWKGPVCANVACRNDSCNSRGLCNDTFDRIVCNCSSSWTGVECQEAVCGSNSCNDHGSCNGSSGAINCTCNAGWTGSTCEKAVCQNDSCYGRGDCNDTSGVIYCSCNSSWSGSRCQEAVCWNNSCSNHGSCNGSSGAINCNCNAGWTGSTCEKAVCQNDSCYGRGDCNDTSGVIYCSCNSSWSGSRCQEAVCFNNSCRNHGSCNGSSGAINCTCNDGWAGSACEREVCLTDSCGGHGSCNDTDGHVICSCRAGWNGPRCDTAYCVPEYCQNNGSCSIVLNAQVCNCSGTGFNGTVCDTDINECNAKVCETANTMHCEDLRGSYTCYCKTGWSGITCKADVNECTRDPCANDTNSSCNNTAGSFDCNCNGGYERVVPTGSCVERVLVSYIGNQRLWGDDVLHGPFYFPQTVMGSGQALTYYVSTNGYIVFGSNYSSITMPNISSLQSANLDIIAPYWADIDIPVNSTTSGLYHVSLSHENKTLFENLKTMMKADWNSSTFTPVHAVVVTWMAVLPHKADDFSYLQESQKATFQVVMATDLTEVKVRLAWRSQWPGSVGAMAKSYYRLFSRDYSVQNTTVYRKQVISSSPTSPAAASSAAECFDWLMTQGTQLHYAVPAIACPCTRQQAGTDLLFEKLSGGENCTKTRVFDTSGRKQRCCYRSDRVGMLVEEGTTAQTFPALANSTLDAQLTTGISSCCSGSAASLTCPHLRQLFPLPRCADYKPPLTALQWGDPHFQTLDGNTYSFNGWGEYHLLSSRSPGSLKIQCRTTKLSNANVTVLSAFALGHDKNDSIQIHLTGNKMLAVYYAGQEVTGSLSLPNVTSVSLTNDSSSSIEIVFQSSLSAKVSAKSDRLSLTLYATLDAVLNARGLLGFVDGNASNDFQYPNGSLLASTATLSPEQLLDFGQSWALQSESDSLFYYNMSAQGDNFTSNQRPDFVPLLVSSAADALKAEINKTYGDGNLTMAMQACDVTVACLQDFLATGDLATAQETKQQLDVVTETRRVLDAKPPAFLNASSVWYVTLTSSPFRHNLSVRAEMTGNDTTYPSIMFTLYDVNGSVLNATLYNFSVDASEPGKLQVMWSLDQTLRSLPTLRVEFTASSSLTNMSVTFQPTIVLCACAAASQCVTSAIDQPMSGPFIKSACQCPPDKLGQFCERDVNVCDACYNVTKCNVSATPVCGSCPAGYEGKDGIKCHEVDECQTGTATCEHYCQNTVGSFVCSCRSGYMLMPDGRSCSDVDECQQTIPVCQFNSYCQNTNGSYACPCRLNFGGPTCTQPAHVYGGQLTFRNLPDNNQGWTDDLRIVTSNSFKTLAEKVQQTISNVLNGTTVRVIKFQTEPDSSRKRRSADPIFWIYATFEVSSTGLLNVTSLNDMLMKGFNPDCSGDECSFGNSALLAVSKNTTRVYANYDVCKTNNPCHVTSTTCTMDNARVVCQCKKGYERWPQTETACLDINECAKNTTKELCGVSDNTTKCTNLEGSYMCSCPACYVWNSVNLTCGALPAGSAGYCNSGAVCHNGGTFVKTSDGSGFACLCTEDWSGPTCNDENSETKRLRGIAIGVGVGFGVLALILAVVLIVICCRKSRSRSKGRGYYNEENESMYQSAGIIPRPTVSKPVSHSQGGSSLYQEMQHEDNMHKYTTFSRNSGSKDSPSSADNGSNLRHYSNPAFSGDEDGSSYSRL